ncbi:hypothetical protein COZ73_02890 [Candidatus Falkowbacteria bacterium CG_4_8_14_3_um_filter_36_11]|uniref:Uncharacterized protein n=1 Tax=Candidatus Falkowbacteria bacterium CG02_land_8_20_14_3_00_36_14 TaxID=1974560 RepID=A0A2M7DLU2_9BACT|nr:MAG: hypothetical protein COS18_04260 [Candidatus Falkowbacteria bacterium CG02_land_8_20_14_3_00_36_14]PIX11317.1 MAG: hypothetical protein COZ73_02890 [Candidatus Falkowbacteria bacterium CG_4_8_14_3_um_filter_36_11]
MDNQNIISPEQQVNFQEQKSKFSRSAVLFIALGAILLVGVSGVSGYFLYKKLNPLSIQQPINQGIAPQPSLELPSKPQEEINPPQKTSDQILWNSPQEIPSLKIFGINQYETNQYSREEEARYYKVGKIIDGQYQDGEIILISAPYDGPAFYPAFYRFVKQENNLVLLKKYSDDLYDSDGLIRSKFTINEAYTIPSLELPKFFNGSQPGQVLDADVGVNAFFSLNNLKKFFTDKDLGDIYATANYPSIFSDIFERHGFYAQAPDGTARVYSLRVDFVGKDNIPAITWSDGTQNKNEYIFTDVTGCGSANYASVISKEAVNPANDLKAAGKNSNGDAIYEFKDINHYLLKDYYDNKYQVFEGQKVSYEEFLTNHPLFFWIDPFDRLIKFQNNKFIPAVECGKPVIYLYPKETIKIAVKVEPKGGLNYSTPNYKNGWFVQADSEGNIIELSSGENYPYLFWEGRGAIYEQPKNGFVVQRENVHDFLVEKLAKLGLNQKEINDFLEFWESKMKDSPFYFVTFLGNREMNQIAPLIIEPKPDTVIRILMDFTPLNSPIDVKEYEIITPQRNGFTVVEWGGVLR